LRTEKAIKKLSRGKKLELIKAPENFKNICKTCNLKLVLIHEAAQWTSSKTKEKTNEQP
jgi:hypothetical protein